MIGAPITFTEFTDGEILFPSKDDANTFFEGIRVPPASASDYGTVKVAALPLPITVVVTPAYTNLNAYDDDGNIASTTKIVTQTTVEELIIQVAALQLMVTNLRQALISSGIGEPL